jgi:hypothetical protein
MQPADNQFTRRGGLEISFHKIVMIRNNLRVLDQKVNASNKRWRKPFVSIHSSDLLLLPCWFESAGRRRSNYLASTE